MIKLGQITTGTKKGVKYLRLTKNMDIYRNYSKNSCYEVLAFNGNGWWSMYIGTLKECRDYIGNETIVYI